MGDYKDDELLHILQQNCRSDGLDLPLAAAEKAIAVLRRQRMLPNFGNAGAVKTARRLPEG